MTTLAISRNFTPQSLTWDTVGAVCVLLRFLFLTAMAAGAVAALFAVIALIPPQFFAGVAIITVYAVIMRPRKAVRQ